ncbi:MAG: 4Fe-4S binding protein [Pirellulales bacterium]|nr:4Fe-4S binding protein [Pirellulales bacterium]
MRLNVFLPFRQKAERGLGRRMLARLGPTWEHAPLRRGIQGACLALFLWLFFYVCWPYTAQPARVWGGWLPLRVDAATGRVFAEAEQAPFEPVPREMVVYVSDLGSGAPQPLGAFRVVDAGGRRLQLQPVEVPKAQRLDRLMTSFGPWSLHEAEPGAWPSHYADELAAKETLAAESFLVLDPLVSLSTALAGRCWVWSLTCAGAVLLGCLVVPRGFCGYVCPLGTLVDLSDWAVGRRVGRLRVGADGWWVRVKYFLLLAVLAASLLGVLLSGFVAAIPVVTRGLAFLLAPLQTATERGWHQVPSPGTGQYLSLALLVFILGLGFLRPRFWCKYACPTGAVFSIGNLLRLTHRRVASSCIRCGRCVEVCPFDAIKPDFTTRATDCTFCQTCGGACPTGAIQFVPRGTRADWKQPGAPPTGNPSTGETTIGRRGFLAAGVGAVAGVGGGLAAASAVGRGPFPDDRETRFPVRPPGSVPERQFLQLCVRCGECYQACPNNVLQPLGFQQGVAGLWTPRVVAEWSGCEPSCNNCGQVCPTGAIRALALEEKRAARMGLAVVNRRTCLPYAGREDCRLCADECTAAGYEAIEFVRVGTQVDQHGNPVEGSGFLAPVVRPCACVGCGLCQTRCYAINAKEKGLLTETAIRIEAGPGKEDRLRAGSYVERYQRRQRRGSHAPGAPGRAADGYLPDFLD